AGVRGLQVMGSTPAEWRRLGLVVPSTLMASSAMLAGCAGAPDDGPEVPREHVAVVESMSTVVPDHRSTGDGGQREVVRVRLAPDTEPLPDIPPVMVGPYRVASQTVVSIGGDSTRGGGGGGGGVPHGRRGCARRGPAGGATAG